MSPILYFSQKDFRLSLSYFLFTLTWGCFSLNFFPNSFERGAPPENTALTDDKSYFRFEYASGSVAIKCNIAGTTGRTFSLYFWIGQQIREGWEPQYHSVWVLLCFNLHEWISKTWSFGKADSWRQFHAFWKSQMASSIQIYGTLAGRVGSCLHSICHSLEIAVL